MSRALPPNFIHSMDAQLLRTAAIMAVGNNIAYVPIHDSFGTHAADFWSLNDILKKSFVETMSYDWYSNFCTSNDVKPTLKIVDSYDYHEAANVAYMFS